MAGHAPLTWTCHPISHGLRRRANCPRPCRLERFGPAERCAGKGLAPQCMNAPPLGLALPTEADAALHTEASPHLVEGFGAVGFLRFLAASAPVSAFPSARQRTHTVSAPAFLRSHPIDFIGKTRRAKKIRPGVWRSPACGIGWKSHPDARAARPAPGGDRRGGAGAAATAPGALARKGVGPAHATAHFRPPAPAVKAIGPERSSRLRRSA